MKQNDRPRHIRFERIARLCIASLLLLLAAIPMTSNAAVDWPSLMLGQAISGLPSPVFMTNAQDGSQRLFVVSQSGYIWIVKGDHPEKTPFLDIHERVNFSGERGMLSIAFPPTYGTTTAKQHFYVYYVNHAGNLVIARYRTTANADIADPTSEQIILTIPHLDQSNHNGGQLAFSPRDGYLYIGTGDGGGAGDPHDNGQNLDTLLGKILRIDVESNTGAYRIPPTNPFVRRSDARHEIWAYGLRNPWRFSFDRQTRDLYIGDVGQGNYEEVDFQVAASNGGQNYGWNRMEGLHCYERPTCDQSGLVLPVTEYSHANGNCSITGGYVYRGSTYPQMQGVYLYGDYCSGQIRGLQHDGTGWATNDLLDTAFNIASFGEDEAGTIYVTDYDAGTIYPIIERVRLDPRIWIPIIMSH